MRRGGRAERAREPQSKGPKRGARVGKREQQAPSGDAGKKRHRREPESKSA